jgi:sugar lactone lactonase YvrE
MTCSRKNAIPQSKDWSVCLEAILLSVLCLSAATADAQTISTFAGGYRGDGRSAVAAEVPYPSAVAFDGQGNLLIADLSSIRRVDKSGVITSIVGTDLWEFPVYYGATSDIRLYLPQSITLDISGNMFIADLSRYNLIRKILTDGTSTYVAGCTSPFIGQCDAGPGDGDLAYTVTLHTPIGTAVDPTGNIYFAERDSHRIRKVGTDGIITTIAGKGLNGGYSGDGGPAVDADLRYPTAILLTAAGNLYFADSGNNVIRQIDTNGTISTLVGNGAQGYSGDNGAATQASLFAPWGLAIDASGALYVADSGNNAVRKIDASGVITTVAGNGTASFSGDGGPASFATLYNPNGLIFDSSGNLYIADTYNNRVRKVTTDNVISTVAGDGSVAFYGDGDSADKAYLNDPSGVAADRAGNFYVSDSENHRIRKITPAGVISTIAGTGIRGYSGDGGPATTAQMRVPGGIATDYAGNLYFADSYYHVIRKISTSGIITTIAGNGIHGYSGDGGDAKNALLNSPAGLMVDDADNIYFADAGNNVIRKITPTNQISTVAGNGTLGYSGDGSSALAARLNYPEGVSVDTRGNVYIADTGNQVVRKVDASGNITTIAVDHGGGQPLAAIATDSGGNVYYQQGSALYKISLDGTQASIAGQLGPGFRGDGGPAKDALLSTMGGIAITANGVIYITDNNRIRRISAFAGYVPLSPNRLLDTRQGAPTFDGLFAGSGALTPNSEFDLTVLGRGGVLAAGVDSVVLNVTLTNPSAAGYITVWPTGVARPQTSNLNFVPQQTVPNLVISKVGPDGKVALFNSAGNTDLIVDIVGYFTAGADMVYMTPQRLMDTRAGETTSDGNFSGIGALAAWSTIDLPIGGRSGIPGNGVSAAIMNVTATDPQAEGYLDIWPANAPTPLTSSLNFDAAQTVPNLVIGKVSDSGQVSIGNGSIGSTDVLVDVMGWFPVGSTYSALEPARLLDTRPGATTTDGQGAGVGGLPEQQTFNLTVVGRGGVPIDQVGAVVLNVTVSDTTTEGFLTVWPGGAPRPLASNLNFTPHKIVANAVIAKVGAGGQVSFFNSTGSTELIVDVVGWFPPSP